MSFNLPPDGLAALQVQKDRQAWDRQKLGEDYADYGLVCFFVLLAAGRPCDRHDLGLRASAPAPAFVRCWMGGDDRDRLANIGACSARLRVTV